MGSSIAGAGGSSGGGRRRRHRRPPMADINMTPFIDVMLCLLIIFMVAAPLLTTGVPLDLPKSAASPVNANKDPLTVDVDPKGDIYLQQTKIALGDLVAKLQAIAQTGYDERIFVRGDKSISYGQVMQVMGQISGAGFKNVVLVSDTEN